MINSPSQTANHIVTLNNVSKFYGTEVKRFEALRQVSFDISSGELVAVTGPPGCGKTTLFNILGLLEPPSSGEVVIGQTPIDYRNQPELNQLQTSLFGYISPSLGLVDYFNVSDNIRLGVRFKDLNETEQESRILHIMQLLDLIHLQKALPCSLSTFEVQKVLLARAIAANPSLLLIDDFGHNLDSRHAMELLNIIRQLAFEGTAVVFTTSNFAMSEFADRTIGLFDGAIVTEQQIPGGTW